MKRRAFLRLVLFGLAGCAAPATLAPPPRPTPGPPLPTPTPPEPAACRPAPIVRPTRPAVIPPTAGLDESTGLHMAGGKVQTLDAAAYRLKVTGKVEHPLELTLDDLRCLTKKTAKVTLTCQGNFEDTTTYSGAPLGLVLEQAGLQSGIQLFYLVGADGDESVITPENLLLEENFLAYQWQDEPLPVLHGFPVRAVIPSLNGYNWVKWLTGIRAE